MFTFVPNKQFGQLITILPHSLMMLETTNIEFQFVEVWFTDQNNRPLAKYRKYIKGYGFLSFARKFGDKYGKKLIDTATKAGIDAAKTASKRVAQKTAEATVDLIINKIDDKIITLGKTKSKEKEDERQEIYIPPEKRELIIDDLRLF